MQLQDTQIRRGRGRPVKQYETFSHALLEQLRRARAQRATIQWPSPRYAQNPHAFCRDILGFDPWQRQLELLEAVRDHDLIACVSGQKTGKTRTVAAIAIWAFCSFAKCQIILMASTASQLDRVLWREIRLLLLEAGVCCDCKAQNYAGPRPCPHSGLIDGQLGDLARTGFKADARIIYGLSAKDIEAVAGISGHQNIFIVDEASKLPESMYAAIRGNTAGGGKICLISNGTRRIGPFWDAFNSKQDIFRTIQISSLETPNYLEGRRVIPGLATRDFIESLAQEYGEESDTYRIRVLGEFPKGAEGGLLISQEMVNDAKARYDTTEPDGHLFIGVDPAGRGGLGDESALVVRRGPKVLAIEVDRGLGEEEHWRWLQSILGMYRRPGEVPVVSMDREGVGTALYMLLRGIEEENPREFLLSGVRASERYRTGPYERVRDKLFANLEQWFREDGGTIPPDSKLERELISVGWIETTRGQLKATGKPALKKLIGRSPDRMDALAVSCWIPAWLAARLEQNAQPKAPRVQPAKAPRPHPRDSGAGGFRDPFRNR